MAPNMNPTMVGTAEGLLNLPPILEKETDALYEDIIAGVFQLALIYSAVSADEARLLSMKLFEISIELKKHRRPEVAAKLDAIKLAHARAS